MEKEDKSDQWKLAYFGLVAVVLGAIIGSGGSWYIWHLQQNALGEQKSLEQHNIATALYYDVDNIEQKLNTSMRSVLLFMNNDTNGLSNPNFIYFEDTRYFSVNWIYDVFGKDISGFDSNTSTDLYGFYENAAEIDYYMQFMAQIGKKLMNNETVRPLDISLAHTYTKGIYGIKIPEGILLAENIKRELRDKYHVNLRLHSIVPYNDVETSFYLQKNLTTDSSTLAINYH